MSGFGSSKPHRVGKNIFERYTCLFCLIWTGRRCGEATKLGKITSKICEFVNVEIASKVCESHQKLFVHHVSRISEDYLVCQGSFSLPPILALSTVQSSRPTDQQNPPQWLAHHHCTGGGGAGEPGSGAAVPRGAVPAAPPRMQRGVHRPLAPQGHHPAGLRRRAPLPPGRWTDLLAGRGRESPDPNTPTHSNPPPGHPKSSQNWPNTPKNFPAWPSVGQKLYPWHTPTQSVFFVGRGDIMQYSYHSKKPRRKFPLILVSSMPPAKLKRE